MRHPPLSTAPPPVKGSRESDGSGGKPRGGAWTVLGMVTWSADYLSEKGIPGARLDAELLLAEALGVNRLQLYLQHDRPLTRGELATFKPYLLRRASREPLQYVLGKTAFREIELLTDPRALIPRPETETLVEVALAWARDRPGIVHTGADVGTGCGCVALSLAREGPFTRLVATDVSERALALARENVQRSGLEKVVDLRQGDLTEPLAGEHFDVLVANLPYVAHAEEEALAPEVRDWEPRDALFAGSDGLAAIRSFLERAPEVVACGGLLALEVGAGQAAAVGKMIEARGGFGEPRLHDDLAGHPRVVSAERSGSDDDRFGRRSAD